MSTSYPPCRTEGLREAIAAHQPLLGDGESVGLTRSGGGQPIDYRRQLAAREAFAEFDEDESVREEWDYGALCVRFSRSRRRGWWLSLFADNATVSPDLLRKLADMLDAKNTPPK